MNVKRCAATLTLAGVLVGGLGVGTASAAQGQPGQGRSGAARSARQFDCSKLEQFTALEARMRQNIQDRIAILTDMKAQVGAERAARLQKRIDRLNAQLTKLDARLAKVTARCSSQGSSTTAGSPVPQ